MILITLAGGAPAAILIGTGPTWPLALLTVAVEGVAAAAVVIAAGGFGWLILRWLRPKDSPTALGAITSAVLGLWMLSTAVLAVGTFWTGLLKPWLFWPVVAAGIVLAAWFGRQRMEGFRFAGSTAGRAIIWMLVAAAAGIALVGAVHPPGWWSSTQLQADEYDVLEYHLQVPRQFHRDQHIGELRNNVYSYFPLGVEMLFLLGMSLRGGAYEGIYLAKFMHLACGVLAVAGAFAAFKNDDHVRGRFAAGLLATTPIAVYLSWLAMVELAQVACLVLAAAWLRQWLAGRSVRAAAIVGLMLGAACASKYLAVGLVAGPVLAAMVLVSLRSAKGLAGVAVAAATTILLFSPWGIRNAAYTRNPVFPLATSIFGRGHWDAESERRWIDGHGPQMKDPVPVPAGYEPPRHRGRLALFVDNFLANEKFGHITMVLAGLAFCVWVARSGHTDLFNAALLAITAGQLAVWTAFTHGMPARFLVPIVAPLCMLAGGLLADLSRVRRSPLRPLTKPVGADVWGVPPAATAFVAAAVVNLLVCAMWYKEATLRLPSGHGLSGTDVAKNVWPWSEAHGLKDGSRLMLVGEARAFYFPVNAAYATVFDAHPLAKLLEADLSGDQILSQLRADGITHVWVNWSDMARLANTYGYPAALVSDMFGRWQTRKPAGTEAFDRMGLVVHKHIALEAPASAPAAAPATQPTTQPFRWPIITIYELPQ